MNLRESCVRSDGGANAQCVWCGPRTQQLEPAPALLPTTWTHCRTSDLAERLDRLPVTRLHAVAMLTCGVGMTIDTLEMAFGGVLGTVFSAQITCRCRPASWACCSPPCSSGR